MVSEIGNVVSTSGVTSAPVAAVPASPSAGSANFASPLASSSAVSSTSALIQNPRIVQDPSAGFITEYLSANGSQIISQTPSAITVAYLRQGLTAQGLSKPPSYESVATTA